MAAPILITRLRLERAYTVLDVAQCADEDADVTDAIQEASDIAWGVLRDGYSEEDIITLCANDTGVSGAIASIAMAKLARRRKEFRLPDGRTMYAADAKAALAHLTSITDGHTRSVAEAAAVASLPATRLLGDRARAPRRTFLTGGGF